jgi:hypothetical protein
VGDEASAVTNWAVISTAASAATSSATAGPPVDFTDGSCEIYIEN